MLPAQLGYRMPAQWEPHAATWLSWPHNRNTWPGKFEPVPAVWAELTRVLALSEAVHICCGGKAVLADARRWVGDVGNVTLHDAPTNDCWMRDHGPTFLVGPHDSPPALIHWSYNAWGNKYPFDLDREIPPYIASYLKRRRFQPDIVLEGGSIDVNGLGALLTSEQCLLNTNRNPQLDRSATEAVLRDYLAVRHVIWLGEGIVGDDTDGHIDELARFVGPRTVVAVIENDPSDENYAPLQDNLRRLRSATDQDGRPLEIVPLALPGPKFYDGQRLPASYANFYIANSVVVVPTFDDPADAAALETLAQLFPTRRIHPLRAIDLVWGLGAVSCITQQQPAI